MYNILIFLNKNSFDKIYLMYFFLYIIFHTFLSYHFFKLLRYLKLMDKLANIIIQLIY